MSITAAFRRLALAALMALGVVASDTFAQTAAPDDPPGRVGRLSYMEGTVSFRDAEEDQWVPATLNFPVTTGASFWTEPSGRAEIQIGSADLRLDQLTAIQVVQLDDTATQIAVDQGAINVRLRDMPPGGVRIITPRATVALIQPGRYHIDVAPPQEDKPGDHVRVAVLEGAARIDGLAAPLTVTTGHSATLAEGEAHPLLAQAISLPIDDWALERERALNPRETVRYVSPEMTGYQDLDRYGQWGTDPSYGAIWYPRTTVVEWAPYRYGHWAYIRPWGWTWIDHEPWGFAPFHYGRWVRVRDRWGWCPGTRVVRPIYAPALVAFVGGNDFSVAVFSGRRTPAVGWVPLGPHEVYRPHHRHSTTYVRNVNITHVNVTSINSTVIHRDRDRDKDRERDSIRGFHNRDGLTVVSSDSFTGAAPVDKARVRVRADDIADAKTTDSLDHLRPSRSAKAGLVVPAVATSGGAATLGDEGRRSRRSRRDDDDRLAPPTGTRTTTALAEPSRNPEVLPQSPGPTRARRAASAHGDADRERVNGRQTGGVEPSDRRNREPVGSPLKRSGQAAPAVRTPNSATAAPSALRSPNDRTRIVPPGRTSGPEAARPSGPPGRQPNPTANSGRDDRDGRDARDGRDRREPDRARIEPRMAPRPLTPTQTPGRAPNTVAPTRPAQIAPTPATPQNLDRSRPAAAPPTRPSEPPRDMQRGNPATPRPGGADRRREESRPNATGGGANVTPPHQGSSSTQLSSPARQAPPRDAVERRSRQQTPQRVEPRLETRRDSRPETRQESRPEPRLERRAQPEPRREARPQAQPSAPRDMTQRRVEPPPRPQPQDAQRRGSGRRAEESQRNGG